MRRSLLLAFAFAGTAFATAALADPPPAAPAPPPPSASFPEFAGGGASPEPRLYRDALVAGAAKAEPVFAVVGDHIVTGASQPDPYNSTGALRLRDAAQPQFVCGGRYRPSNEGGLSVQLACSDGSRFTIRVQEFSDDAGFGHASARGATASLCYGFRAKHAAHHLVAPAGYELVAEQGQLSLRRAGA